MRSSSTVLFTCLLSLSLFANVALLFELQQERVSHLQTKAEYLEFATFVRDNFKQQRDMREQRERLEAEARQRSFQP